MGKRVKVIAAVMAVVMLAAACGNGDGDGGDEGSKGTAGSGEPVANPDLVASDVGVTATEVRVAVMADVDNAIVPGLFSGAKRGVEAYAEYINANGGVAGRRLVVDFLDSKLSPDSAQSGSIEACENDFALVGTSALFLNNTEPLLECTDAAGAVTGLPDVAVATASFAHQCSATTFPISGSTLYCDTKDENPQSYAAPVGGQRWLKEENDVSVGTWIVGGDIDATRQATMPIVTGEQKVGIEGEPVIISGLAPQATYTPFVQRLKADGVEYVGHLGAASQLALALKEMTIQGVHPKVVVCTTACYGDEFLEQADGLAEGTYIWLPQLPNEDADAVPPVKAMVDGIGSGIDGFARMAWMASMLFVAAVEDVVEAHGENGLTRANLLAALSAMTDFDAEGMLGATLDLAAKKNPECFVVMQVKGDGFERVHPKEAGEMDCEETTVDVKFDNK